MSNDPFDLSGKHIIVTGASSGFGHHFAGLLADRGAAVSLGARRVEKIESRAAELNAQGGRALAARLDVCDAESRSTFFEEAERAFGPATVLINNAGIEAGAKSYMMIEEDDWDSVLDTNLKSAWAMCKLFTERVIAGKVSDGNIVNVSSITDRRTIKGQFPYAISKAGITRMTEILALEGPKYGIRANALAPGYILTDVSRILLESPAAPEFMKGIPMRRFGEFEDLDGPLLLLASDASRYMNGSVIVVDGGHVCGSL